jgi:hypothetical protein
MATSIKGVPRSRRKGGGQKDPINKLHVLHAEVTKKNTPI